MISDGTFVNEVIIRYDVSTGIHQTIYESPHILMFRNDAFTDKLAFNEKLSDGTFNKYFYDGSSIHFVINASLASINTLKDGLLYKESGTPNSPLFYWNVDGTISVYHPSASGLESTNCYVLMSNAMFSSDITTELIFSNGLDRDSIFLDGFVNQWILEGNNLLIDFLENWPVGDHYLIRMRHNLPCLDVCPDENAFVDFWNAADFINTKTIESIATIPTLESTLYEASDHILLASEFEVTNGAVFLAEIVSCP